MPIRKLPYNYDNFKKMAEEVEELQDLIVKLNARLAIVDTPVEEKKAPVQRKKKAKA